MMLLNDLFGEIGKVQPPAVCRTLRKDILNWIGHQASSPIFEDDHESFMRIFMGVPGPLTDILKGFMDHRHFSHDSPWFHTFVYTLASLLLFSWSFIPGPPEVHKQQTMGMEETSSSDDEEENTDISIIRSHPPKQVFPLVISCTISLS